MNNPPQPWVTATYFAYPHTYWVGDGRCEIADTGKSATLPYTAHVMREYNQPWFTVGRTMVVVDRVTLEHPVVKIHKRVELVELGVAELHVLNDGIPIELNEPDVIYIPIENNDIIETDDSVYVDTGSQGDWNNNGLLRSGLHNEWSIMHALKAHKKLDEQRVKPVRKRGK